VELDLVSRIALTAAPPLILRISVSIWRLLAASTSRRARERVQLVDLRLLVVCSFNLQGRHVICRHRAPAAAASP
jgi:hypothetical protein